mmetsp:Transcript_3130/g.4748  ORF Transcript_3130/g.4748 Transcript_3130/m.4748 type:complete len:199 (-) Transcript_3130:199-795(-)|eukprot:CAMPEP_0197241482 /NCGR_PEP_ID=MMETSP1429-20130617/7502_1 /TAXON_ID=49237 /ORGANISM="Chaetoceros  sp., Strain UNC1202" /LENGTH=198 /DNA_ID=CAMNT_0042701325 /DNA_START=22 /DNA_END=618 /DNA_ORIENTATION=+
MSCASEMASTAVTVALGAGCFWGTEKFIKKDFASRFPGSVREAKVGYMSPSPDHVPNPSYKRVCSGETSFVEVLNIELNVERNGENTEDALTELLKFFFMFHDPTTKDRQINDTGTQYASAIFVQDEQQRKIAEKVKKELQDAMDENRVSTFKGKTVVTDIHDATTFYAAEDYHQEYLSKNPSGYCNHYLRMKEWPLF